jgi:hypothetical protein
MCIMTWHIWRDYYDRGNCLSFNIPLDVCHVDLFPQIGENIMTYFAWLCIMLLINSFFLVILLIKNRHLSHCNTVLENNNTYLNDRCTKMNRKVLELYNERDQFEEENARARRRSQAIGHLLYVKDVDIRYEGNNYMMVTK